MAAAQLERAEALASAGDRTGALDAARIGLEQAREAAHLPTIARGQLTLGRLTEDVGRIEDAIALYAAVGEAPAEAEARLALARLALRARAASVALAQLDALAALPGQGLPAGPDERALVEAERHHVRAAALRLSGRQAEAAAAERQARLSLTLVDDRLGRPLQLAVRQALGDDLALAGAWQDAAAEHARAAALARALDDARAQLLATAALAADLEGLRRWADAFDQCLIALRLAHRVDAPAAIGVLAVRGRRALDALQAEADDERRALLEREERGPY